MANNKLYDVIIVGGSYAGLAAAMALGRALKQVLVIDSGLPCNRQTPFSHNFLTQDGKPPLEIMQAARLQVSAYDTIGFLSDTVVRAKKSGQEFEIETYTGENFFAKKLIFATGIRDLLPDIDGIQACWGISVIHCPYCHGYEVRHEKTGLLSNSEITFEHTKMISNWTKDLTLFTNGPSVLTAEQANTLRQKGINIVETPVESVQHKNGHLTRIILNNGDEQALKALYAQIPFEQHCAVPEMLGCQLTPEGFIKTDMMQETSVEGVFACGDNTGRFRSVANAVATGTMAGAAVSRKLIMEEF
ncbi:MAG: NAD(P)/FAD-dependent oxidoreductase [Chitinophagaceae bacterium]